jgi:hypothetical protein
MTLEEKQDYFDESIWEDIKGVEFNFEIVGDHIKLESIPEYSYITISKLHERLLEWFQDYDFTVINYKMTKSNIIYEVK